MRSWKILKRLAKVILIKYHNFEEPLKIPKITSDNSSKKDKIWNTQYQKGITKLTTWSMTI